MKFKLLAGALVLLMVGWFVWWRVAASAQEAAVTAWLDAQRDRGWQAEAASVEVAGFPNRLDLTLTEPALADPAEGWAWSAPRFFVRQVIYDPTFFVMEWPVEQRLAAPGARATLRTEEMEASLKVAAASSLDLVRASFDVQRAALAADAGWTAGAERLTLHVREAPDAGPANAYQFRFDGIGVRPPDFLRRRIDPAGALPAVAELAAAEGRAAFDRPLDRRAAEGPPPALTALSLKEARAVWGGLELSVAGALVADEEGRAEGELDLSATNWREMLAAAVASGAVDRRLADALEAGLGFVAGLSGAEDRLDVSVTFSGGLARIGPVPIGPAPRMNGGI
ncbi:MAG: DUF2125 domain-containing protein [Pseudomonadota bacterium]